MLKNKNIVFSYPFSSAILNDFFFKHSSDRLVQIFNEFDFFDKIDKNWTLRDFFENSYKQLLKNYRNEYVFKNAIAKKILIGRHSIKSSSLFSELRVGTSKADIVIFNGTSHVYEIKTELDNLDRLQGQIEDYKQVFEFVNVVTVESKINEIKSLLNEEIGIIILSDKYSLKTIRKAQSGLQSLEKGAIFSLLRKNEYLKIIEKYYKNIPNVPNTKIYNVCQELFVDLSIDIIQKEVLNTLKNRRNHSQLVDTIKKFPDSLKMAVIEANLTVAEQNDFLRLLNQRIYTVLK